MQEALPIPAELLVKIFSWMPLFSQFRLSATDKKRLTFFNDHILFNEDNAQKILSTLFDESSSPFRAKRAITYAFSQKKDIVEKRKDESFSNSVLFILMGFLNSLKPERLNNALSEIKDRVEGKPFKNSQYNKKAYKIDSASALSRSLFMSKYASSDKKFKNENRRNFIALCSEGTEGAIFVNFKGGNIADENFSGKNFSGSSFVETHIEKTNFSKGYLVEANFKDAKADNTNFEEANLLGANLLLKGSVKFSCLSILICAELSDSLKKTAASKKAILTLDDLVQRMKEYPDHFPEKENLMSRAITMVLRKTIERYDALPNNKRDNHWMMKKENLNTLYSEVKKNGLTNVQTMISSIKNNSKNQSSAYDTIFNEIDDALKIYGSLNTKLEII